MADINTSRVDIKEKAAFWVMKIDQGSLSNEEHSKFVDWILEDQLHKDYFLKLADQWDLMGLTSVFAAHAPIHKVKKEQREGVAQKALVFIQMLLNSAVQHRYTAIASTACLVLFVVVTLQLSDQKTDSYYTQVGEQKTVHLIDGSQIQLNTNTHIAVRMNADKREISLLTGEAKFNVAKDKQRPFVVTAGNGTIQAVGTVFTIRHTAAEVSVMVTEGSVKVSTFKPEKTSNKSQEVHEALLTAGNEASYDKEIKYISPLNENKLAWIDGVLIFDGETLTEVINEVSRYTEKKLLITDESIKNLRVGGIYKTKDLDSLLLSLDKTMGIKSETLATGEILLKKL